MGVINQRFESHPRCDNVNYCWKVPSLFVVYVGTTHSARSGSDCVLGKLEWSRLTKSNPCNEVARRPKSETAGRRDQLVGSDCSMVRSIGPKRRRSLASCTHIDLECEHGNDRSGSANLGCIPLPSVLGSSKSKLYSH